MKNLKRMAQDKLGNKKKAHKVSDKVGGEHVGGTCMSNLPHIIPLHELSVEE